MCEVALHAALLLGDTQEITECRRRRQAATTSPLFCSTPDADDRKTKLKADRS